MDSEDDARYDLDPNFEHIVFQDTSRCADLSGEGIFTSAETRDALTAMVEKYEADVESVLGHKVHSKIMAYLRLIPLSWPFKVILVGQNPYKETILPTYASALAYDSSFCPGFTPSVQVLSQFITFENKDRTSYIASLLGVSYILIADEILMINAMPCITENSVLNMRISSFTSELIRGLILCNYNAGVRGLSLVRLGGAAKACVENALDSVSAKVKAQVQIESVDLEHPASIARKYRVWAGGNIREPSDQCQEINFEFKEGRKDMSVKRSYDTYGHHRWHRYLDFQIKEMGKLTKIRRFTKILNEINVELTWKSFRQIMKASMSSSSGHSKFVKKEQGDGGESQLSYVDKMLNFSWKLANDARSGWEEDRIKFQESIEKYNATGVDKDYERMIEMSAKIMQSISRVAQSLRSVHANVVSSQSAIPSSQGKVVPIARLGINVTLDDTKASLKTHAKLRAKAQALSKADSSASSSVVIVDDPSVVVLDDTQGSSSSLASKLKLPAKDKGKAVVRDGPTPTMAKSPSLLKAKRNTPVVTAPVVIVDTESVSKPASLEQMKKRVLKQKVVSPSSSVSNVASLASGSKPKLKVKRPEQAAVVVVLEEPIPPAPARTLQPSSKAPMGTKKKVIKKKPVAAAESTESFSSQPASSVSSSTSENMHGMLNLQIAPGNMKGLQRMAALMKKRKD